MFAGDIDWRNQQSHLLDISALGSPLATHLHHAAHTWRQVQR